MAMVVALLMLLGPVVVFLLSLPFTRSLRPRLRAVYRIAGAIVVFTGGAVTCYFAAYTGDQGGIAAFFFQIVVILVYVALSITLLFFNWLFNKNARRK
jgi:hypothetical protein